MLLSSVIDRKKRISAFNSAYFKRKYCSNFTVFCRYSLCWAWTTASVSRLGRIIMRIPLIFYCIYYNFDAFTRLCNAWLCSFDNVSVCQRSSCTTNLLCVCMRAKRDQEMNQFIFEFVIANFSFLFQIVLSFSRLTYAELQNWRKKIRCD